MSEEIAHVGHTQPMGRCMVSEALKTIFLVDDDPDIRSSLARSLIIRGFNVQQFASADEFLAAYDPALSGCLILDQGMPGTTGLELQSKLSALNITLPIIFISGHSGVRESVLAMKGGAFDFLEKPFRQSDLMDAINAALDTESEKRQGREMSAEFKSRLDRLTPRELEIVNLMLDRPSEVSSKEIARRLDISPRTVDNHRARILEKMNIASVVELVHLAKSAG